MLLGGFFLSMQTQIESTTIIISAIAIMVKSTTEVAIKGILYFSEGELVTGKLEVGDGGGKAE